MSPLLSIVTVVAQIAAGDGPGPVRLPDVAIGARVRADSLIFETVPRVEVTFTGNPGSETVDRTERINLPESVEPRVLYRDIGVVLTITSTLPDIEEIVDEALGNAATPPPAADAGEDESQ